MCGHNMIKYTGRAQIPQDSHQPKTLVGVESLLWLWRMGQQRKREFEIGPAVDQAWPEASIIDILA